MTPQTDDLLIIGGGVLGAFHAYHAQQRGLRVRLLERNEKPQGATVRNFGQVVPSGMDQHWQALGRESLRLYLSIQKQVDLSVRQLGTIYIASDDEELILLEELSKLNADVDYASELWTAEQCQRRYPQLRADYCEGGLFFPDEISVNPRVMIHQFHRFLRDSGNIAIHYQSAVNRLSAQPDGCVIATTCDGRAFAAEKAIVCGGDEFKLLFPDLFESSDLETVQLQMLRLVPQPGVKIPGNVLTGSSIRRYESFAQCPSWEAIKSKEPKSTFVRVGDSHTVQTRD